MKRDDRRRETERAIRAAALRLFLAHGFEATTTKQIADAAGVAHGTVFLVAPTKEALLVAVFEEPLRAIVAARAASLPARGLAAQLGHLFDGLFEFYAREPALTRVFLRGILFFSDPISRAQYDEHVARFTAHVAQLFEAARARGELGRGTRPVVAATNVLGLYLLAVLGFLNEPRPDRRALSARFRAGIAAQLRGLR